jgi:enoyl-CoA hydratase
VIESLTSIEYQPAARQRVAHIVLNRPEVRNAQSYQMLYELNEAFDAAAQDDSVSVIVLSANGPHFSSGHDLRQSDPLLAFEQNSIVGTWCGFRCDGAEGRMAIEKELYLGFSERWRNIPKPTIAAVHGKVVAGGLMLAWPCDLIVASEDAEFLDNTVDMGIPGAEFFAHPWEVGFRKAKEWLFTATFMTAVEAKSYGMVNHIVPRHELLDFTFALADRIAAKPLFALKLAKESVNQAQDAQGRREAMQAAFVSHQLSHAHNQVKYGQILDPNFTRPGSRKMQSADRTPPLGELPDEASPDARREKMRNSRTKGDVSFGNEE